LKESTLQTIEKELAVSRGEKELDSLLQG